jgi:hypothetical protein
MSHDHVPRVSRDLRMSCDHFRKTLIHSCDICSAAHAVLNTWVPLRGISGDVCMCILCSSIDTLTMIA